MKQIVNPMNVFEGAFGGLFFALGRVGMATELEWWWTRSLEFDQDPAFKILECLMRATVECGNLPFFEKQLEAMRGTDRAWMVPDLQESLWQYRLGVARNVKKQLANDHMYDPTTMDEKRQTITRVIESMDGLRRSIESGEIHDLTKNPLRPVSDIQDQVNEKQRERWSKELYDQKFDAQFAPNSRLHGQSLPTRTNLTPPALRLYHWHGFNRLMLRADHWDGFMWRRTGNMGQKLAEYNYKMVRVFDWDKMQSFRDSNINDPRKDRYVEYREYLEERRIYMHLQQEANDDFDKYYKSLTEEEFKSEVNRLRREPGFWGP